MTNVTIETPPAPTPRTIYTIYTRAKIVEQRGSPHWWAQFEGSWEALRFGEEKPFVPGDMVKITFEKVIQND
jgi:hypothetical protein